MTVDKYKQFIDFVYTYKLPRLTQKLPTSELVSLYMEYSPIVYSSEDNLYNKSIATTIVFIVSEELKNRYPNNVIIQHWDTSKPIDLVTALSLV